MTRICASLNIVLSNHMSKYYHGMQPYGDLSFYPKDKHTSTLIVIVYEKPSRYLNAKEP